MSKDPNAYKKYIAWDQLPHMWCPGCGHGTILKAITMALGELEIPPHEALLTSGIGCSGRMGDYTSFHRFQGTHGRALAFATGIKAAQPDLNVIAFLGDGDCYAIGGNHLLHAARRNLDVTVIVGNNNNYGMTGGQMSPSTPTEKFSTTSKLGKAEYPIDMCSVVAEAGANFVARSSLFHHQELFSFIKQGITTKGFSFIEIIVPCPTYYGRYNKLGSAVEMIQGLKDTVIPIEKYEKLSEEEKQNYYWRGIKVQRDREDFNTLYSRYYHTANSKGGVQK